MVPVEVKRKMHEKPIFVGVFANQHFPQKMFLALSAVLRASLRIRKLFILAALRRLTSCFTQSTEVAPEVAPRALKPHLPRTHASRP
jgi:hypothetical protein